MSHFETLGSDVSRLSLYRSQRSLFAMKILWVILDLPIRIIRMVYVKTIGLLMLVSMSAQAKLTQVSTQVVERQVVTPIAVANHAIKTILPMRGPLGVSTLDEPSALPRGTCPVGMEGCVPLNKGTLGLKDPAATVRVNETGQISAAVAGSGTNTITQTTFSRDADPNLVDLDGGGDPALRGQRIQTAELATTQLRVAPGSGEPNLFDDTNGRGLTQEGLLDSTRSEKDRQ